MAFHGTKREFLEDIIEKGLDPKLAKPGFFGKGVYFATTPSLAHKFTAQTCYEPEEEGHSEDNCLKCSRFLLVCDILLGKPEKRIHKDPQEGALINATQPMIAGRHSVIGRDQQSGDTVMTVYNRAQAHPKYIVEYCITRPFPR